MEPSGKEKSFFSTVGGIILIVFISLLVIAIIAYIIFYIVSRYCIKNQNEENNQQLNGFKNEFLYPFRKTCGCCKKENEGV